MDLHQHLNHLRNARDILNVQITRVEDELSNNREQVDAHSNDFMMGHLPPVREDNPLARKHEKQDLKEEQKESKS